MMINGLTVIREISRRVGYLEERQGQLVEGPFRTFLRPTHKYVGDKRVDLESKAKLLSTERGRRRTDR